MSDRRTARAVAAALGTVALLAVVAGKALSPGAGTAIAADEKSAPAAPKANPVAGPVKIETLTVADRKSLADTTTVLLPSGRTATLGALRQDSKSRSLRFSEAARLGSNLAASLKAAQFLGLSQVPFKVAKGMAADYEAFCGSVRASGCLFVPGPLTLLFEINNNRFKDIDWLVTDPAICQSEGGSIDGSACVYFYPATYSGSFNPGPPAAGQQIGGGLKSQQSCMSPLTVSIDPHGALELSGIPLVQSGVAQTSGTLTCVASVYVSPAK